MLAVSVAGHEDRAVWLRFGVVVVPHGCQIPVLHLEDSDSNARMKQHDVGSEAI